MSMPEPVFAAPWHAQLFALTVALNEAGHFTWPEWAEIFGASLRQHGLTRELDGGEDYFHAWLDALERMLATRGLAEADAVAALRAQWEAAYISTPHGAPVRLTEAPEV
ncbi:nitrile hydratase accessory protein [Sulfitobacter sp. LCG007]